MRTPHVEVKLDKKKCLNKEYFDKMYNKFARLVQKEFILEEVRAKKRYYKPSAFKKIKKEIFRNRWKI